MKPKILLISLILLIILVAISLLSSNESAKKPIPPVAKQPQEPIQDETPMRDYSHLLPSAASVDPAITVVKTAAPQKKANPVPIAEDAQIQTEEINAQAPAPANGPSDTGTSASPGKNKYLTENQKKEMRAHNVVLF